MRAHRVSRVVAWLFCCALLLMSGGVQARGKATVHYEVSIPQPHTQYVHVDMHVSGTRGRHVDVAMPAWTPGSYLVRDFGRHVYDVLATDDDGKRLAFDRLDKQTWRVHHRGADFRVRYRVFADELSVRTSYLDSRFAVLNGTSVFLYVVGQLDRTSTLNVAPPVGWQVHTALPAAGKGWQAADYDTLADSPLVLGLADVRTYTVDDATFDYVYLAPSGSNADVDRLAADSKQIVTSFGQLLGGFPFARYKFLVVATPDGRGGLEHFDSTVMMVRSHSFDDEAGYRRAAGLAAHEFFHLWNVKRIHDRVLGPFDYARENYTDLLWFHEGFTSAMAERAMLHAGLIDGGKYLEGLQDSWRSFLRRPGRNYEPLAQVSRDAWIKGYQPARNHRDVTISYYQKGELLGVLLDLELHARSAKHGKQGSLAGVFRRLWHERKAGSTERSISVADVVRATSAEAGEDMAWFFARFVDGTDELTLPAALIATGVKVEADVAWATKPDVDAAARTLAERKRVWSGVVGDGSEIVNVVPRSPADRAGLALGDEVVAVDGVRADSWSEARERMADRRVGDTTTVAFYRGGRLEMRAIELGEDPYKVWKFSLPRDGASTPVLDRWLYRDAAGERRGADTASSDD